MARWISIFLLMAAVLGCPGRSASAQHLDNLFFLHHSTGQGFISQGSMRAWLSSYNSAHGTHYVFWDHDYNSPGLRRPTGALAGWSYNIPNDNTDPIGLHALWTTANAARDSILHNHEVIAFKSCFPASAIATPQLLAQYKTWYLAIRGVLDQHPDKVFVVMSTPPLHRLATNLTEADNARAFAEWLKSTEFLQGHPNIVVFDLFDILAAPNVPGNSTRNMLRYEYELNHSSNDSHPNPAANAVVGPLLASALVTASNHVTPVPLPETPRPSLGLSPNPFNPATVASFDLAAEDEVSLEVFDLRGRLVRSLVHDRLPAGGHRVRWDGNDDRGAAMAAGVYLCRLETGGGVATKAVSLVR